MKRLLIAGSLGLILLLTVALGSAGAKVLKSYCSPSGDYCTNVTRAGNDYFLKLGTFSFKGNYRVCARPKGISAGPQQCNRYPLVKKGSLYRSKVNFLAGFEVAGNGKWCASWHKFGSKLGPSLCFAYNGPIEE